MKSAFGFKLRCSWLCCDEECFQFECSEQKLSSCGVQRDHFVLFAAGSKVLPDFLERTPESLGRGQRTEAQHRIVSLLHGAVISFNSTIQICVAAMLHFRTERFPYCARIRV